MTCESPEPRRVAAQCRRCGTAYAAERWPDETIRPIGRRDGCPCGSTEFGIVVE